MPWISIKGMGHNSTYLFLETRRPGTHRRAANRTQLTSGAFLCYVCVPFNNSYFAPTWAVQAYRYTLQTNSVEMTGFEPVTFALQRRCSPAELHPQDLPRVSGLDRIRTCDPSLIRTVL